MSVASALYQCTWLADANTYTIALMGDTGDISQVFSGNASAPNQINPNIDAISNESEKPVLKTVLMCSDPDVANIASLILPSETVWSVNGDKLVFNAEGVSTGDYAGLFKLIAPDTAANAKYPCGGLRVLKNLVTASGGIPMTITNVLTIEVGANTAKVQASYTVQIRNVDGQAAICEIYCDASDSFVLDRETNPSVECKVRYWNGDLSKDVTVAAADRKWYLLTDGAWVLDTAHVNAAGNLVVDRDMINTFGTVKVEIMSGTSVMASDMQAISDNSDSLILFPNPNPEDGRIAQSDTRTGVIFTPTVRSRETNAEITGLKYLFTVLSPEGTIIANTSAKVTTYTVTRAMFEAINFGPAVNITAYQDT